MSKLNRQKISKVYDSIYSTLDQEKFTVEELVILYANIGNTIGASIDDIEDNLTLEQLEEKYVINPTLGVALMLQAKNNLHWIGNLQEKEDDE